MLVTPALSQANWQSLADDPQLPQALAATLVSAIIATLGALVIALFLSPRYGLVNAGVACAAICPGYWPFPMLLSPPASC
jgi:ABC-type spermidine/putrescine transport system permease subunit II